MRRAVLLPWPDCGSGDAERRAALRAAAAAWAERQGLEFLDLLDSTASLAELRALIGAIEDNVWLHGPDATMAELLGGRSVCLDSVAGVASGATLADRRVARLRALGLAPLADAQCGDLLSRLEPAMRANLELERPS